MELIKKSVINASLCIGFYFLHANNIRFQAQSCVHFQNLIQTGHFKNHFLLKYISNATLKILLMISCKVGVVHPIQY